MGFLLLDIETEPEPEYDHPNMSVWVVGVDFTGSVFVIKPPSIHPSFLEYQDAEFMGLPPDLPDTEAGVYKMTCGYVEHIDWESGVVDDYDFICEKLEPLYVW